MGLRYVAGSGSNLWCPLMENLIHSRQQTHKHTGGQGIVLHVKGKSQVFALKGQYQFIFYFISRDRLYLLHVLKCDHAFTLVAVRLHFQSPFTDIHVETEYRDTVGHVKVASYR